MRSMSCSRVSFPCCTAVSMRGKAVSNPGKPLKILANVGVGRKKGEEEKKKEYQEEVLHLIFLLSCAVRGQSQSCQ